MTKTNITLVAALLIGATSTGCNMFANDEDCKKLGEKTVELTEKELGMELGEDLAKSTAEQVETECKEKTVLKSEVDCIMKAETLDDLDGC